MIKISFNYFVLIIEFELNEFKNISKLRRKTFRIG